MTHPLDLDALRHQAHLLGFARAHLVPADLLEPEALRLWLEEARHGPLDYMSEHLRHRPELLLDQARSILVVTASYHTPDSHTFGHLEIARYAHHLDYHEVLRERLARLSCFIEAETGAQIASRSATDSAPLLERALAARAGLGWVGKNTLLIHPRLGSYMFIAELLLDLDLPSPSPTPEPNRCGRCSRCLSACPTQAIVAPYLLDARRCISTWTIESSGPIPRWIRPLIGDMLFGCDICQEVCPWNNKALVSTDQAFIAPRARLTLRPEDILRMTSRQFNRVFAHSPILRAGRHGLARNAAVVLGNRADDSALDVLEERAAIEPSALVRAHIAWALGQFDTSRAISCLERLDAHDPSPGVREEALSALERLGLRPPERLFPLPHTSTPLG